MSLTIVTTPYRPTSAQVEEAQRMASELGAKYIERREMSLRKLHSRYHPEHLAVITSEGIQWFAGETDSKPFFFHPGLSVVRAKRLIDGQKDPMLEACRFEPGDDVLDCTAGLASDAILFAFAGGESSMVTALESQFPLYYVVSRGLQVYESEIPDLNAAMRRIRAVHADHAALLPTLPDQSVDIVYFDPMFREPVHASTGISPLRALADERTITPEAVQEAKRVARKFVVLKELRDSGEFERLGFEKDQRVQSKVAYGVIRL